MKYITKLGILLFLVISIAGCSSAAKNHHEEITKVCNDVADNYERLITSIFLKKEYKKGKEKVDAFLKQQAKAKEKLEAITEFKDNDSFREAAINYVDAITKVAENEMTEYITLSLEADKVVSEESEAILDENFDLSSLEKNLNRRKEIMVQIDGALEVVDNRLHQARKEFIQDNNLKE
jgi:hypothetical protein